MPNLLKRPFLNISCDPFCVSLPLIRINRLKIPFNIRSAQGSNARGHTGFQKPSTSIHFETKLSKVQHCNAQLKSLTLKPEVANIRIYSDLLQRKAVKFQPASVS